MRTGLKKGAAFAGVAAGVYIGMRFLLPLILPFLAGALLARCLYPFTEKLERRFRIRRTLSGGIILTLLAALFAWGVYLLLRALFAEVRQLILQFDSVKESLDLYLDRCCCSIEELTGITSTKTRAFFLYSYSRIRRDMEGTLTPKMLRFTVTTIRQTAVFLAGVVAALLSGVLFLRDLELLKRKLGATAFYQKAVRIAHRLLCAGGSYIKAQLWIMGIVAVICCVGFFLLGNPYYLLSGIALGLLDALPVLGTGTVLIPWGIFLLLQGDYMLGVGHLILFLVTNLTREFLEPKLVGDKIGLYPVLVLASVYIGIAVYGIWGFFLGPLSAILIGEICKEI